MSFGRQHENDDQQADPLWVSIAKLTDAARDCSAPPSDAEVRKQLLALLGSPAVRGRSPRRRSGSATSGEESPAARSPARKATAARPAMSDDARRSRQESSSGFAVTVLCAKADGTMNGAKTDGGFQQGADLVIGANWKGDSAAVPAGGDSDMNELLASTGPSADIAPTQADTPEGPIDHAATS